MSAPVSLSVFLILSMAMGCASMDSSATAYNPGPHDPNATQIGLILPMSLSAAGQQPKAITNSVRLAVAEINAAGAVNGKPLEVLLRDDKLDPVFAEQAARELIDTGVVALMTSTSGVTQHLIATVTDSARVPIVSPSATSPTLTGAAVNGTFFRTAPSDAFQGAILANEVFAQGVRDIAIIRIGNAYGIGLSDIFKARFQALGGTLRTTVEYPAGKTVGFTQEVQDLFSKGVPSAVLIVAYLVDGANISRDIQLFNPLPKPRFFGTEGLYDSSFLANGAGSVLNGFMGTTNAAPTSSPQYQYFAAQYLAGVGEKPILFSETAYDAVYLMALAMQQGKANTRAALLANLRSVSNYSATPANDVVVGPGEWAKALQALQAGKHVKYLGASGTIAWDANGDVTSGTYSIYRITAGNQAPSFDILKTVTFP